MVGFTANAKILVDRLAKYLRLSDLFIDIATDEDILGGGKENAVFYLIKKMESKGIAVPKDRLIFVGDSLRGDIGIGLAAREKDREIKGQGILVLKNREALVEVKREISKDPALRALVDSIDIHGLVISNVPLDETGKPMLLSRFKSQFLEKL